MIGNFKVVTLEVDLDKISFDIFCELMHKYGGNYDGNMAEALLEPVRWF